ncbi:hypothetical protein [Curtobacterium sp. MCSS17_016]|uniref:hypothetical protein n=1 Tax=Curtobacterium sp. MCSS17_016 TaxID=2175644 RepID=UPI000DAA82DE|nr:hypothetical protein [Curtobacterium sp. MCSS17_016]WIE81178.1 hypothetical protein DEJ19_018265 [Curtobacterium sp. MCSS17_016]
MSQHEARVPRFTRATLTSADGITAAQNVQTITIEQDGAYFQIIAGNGGFEIRQADTNETTGLALLPSGGKSVVVETRWNGTYAKARRLEGIRDHRLVCDDCGAELAWHADALIHAGTQSEYSVYPLPHIATAPSPTADHPPIPAV